MRKTKIIIILFILFGCAGLISNNHLFSQSLVGNTGLLRIPTAQLEQDRTLSVGSSFLSKNLLAYSDYQYDAITGFANLTFLPFLELGMRYTRQINRGPGGYDSYFADRMLSFKLKILNEKTHRPALAIGSTDFLSSIKNGEAQFFTSYYAVLTKALKNKSICIETSLGYAFKIGNTKHYDMMGLFAGLKIYHLQYKWFSAMVDYDTKYWNLGFSLFLFNHLQIMPVLRNGRYLEGNICYRIYL